MNCAILVILLTISAISAVYSYSPDFSPPESFASLSNLSPYDQDSLDTIQRFIGSNNKACGNRMADLLQKLCRGKLVSPKHKRFGLVGRNKRTPSECCGRSCTIQYLFENYCDFENQSSYY